MSIVGLRGATLGLSPAYGESPLVHKNAIVAAIPERALGLVQYVASDSCSRELHRILKDVLPGLKGVSLDPMHICFASDRVMQKDKIKSKVSGLVLRAIMGKFDVRHPQLAGKPLYTGGPLAAMTATEKAGWQHIADGSLPQKQALATLEKMDPNEAITTLSSFCKLIAAFASVFPEKLGSVDDQDSFRRSLMHIAKPQQFQWLMNNVKIRSTLDLTLDTSKAVTCSFDIFNSKYAF